MMVMVMVMVMVMGWGWGGGGGGGGGVTIINYTCSNVSKVYHRGVSFLYYETGSDSRAGHLQIQGVLYPNTHTYIHTVLVVCDRV